MSSSYYQGLFVVMITYQWVVNSLTSCQNIFFVIYIQYILQKYAQCVNKIIIIIKCNDDKEHLKNKKQMMFATRSISTCYRRSNPPRPEGPAAALELAGGPRVSRRSDAIEQGDKPRESDGKLMISRVRQLHGQNNELIYIQPFRSSLALPHVLHSRTAPPLPLPNTHTPPPPPGETATVCVAFIFNEKTSRLGSGETEAFMYSASGSV